MKKITKTNKILALTLVFLLNFLFLPTILAAPLTSLSNTLTRLKVSEPASHTIVFTTTSGISSAQTVTLTFPATSFTMGASLSGVTINGNAVTSASWSAPTLTITASGSSTVAPGNIATIVIPNTQITNPSTPGTYVIDIAGTFGDTGKIAVAIVGDDSFAVNANVDPTITFSIDSTSVNFGTLSSTSVATAVSAQTSNSFVRLLTSTNAPNGYAITVRDTGNGINPGLYSAGANHLIQSATTDLTSNYGYGLQATSTSATIASPYNVTSNNVGAFQLAYQSLAQFAGVADSQQVDLVLKTKVSGAAPSGSYVDSVVIIATARF